MAGVSSSHVDDHQLGCLQQEYPSCFLLLQGRSLAHQLFLRLRTGNHPTQHHQQNRSLLHRLPVGLQCQQNLEVLQDHLSKLYLHHLLIGQHALSCRQWLTVPRISLRIPALCCSVVCKGENLLIMLAYIARMLEQKNHKIILLMKQIKINNQ